MAVLDTSEDIVDCPDTFRSDQYCRTALGVQKDLVKSLTLPSSAQVAILCLLYRYFIYSASDSVNNNNEESIFVTLSAVL